MLRNVILPTLGLDMEEAVIEKWLKREGDSVVKDEPILVVETEKASMEINAPASGVIKQILQPEGATVPVTQTIAILETSEPEEAAVGVPVAAGSGGVATPNGQETPAAAPVVSAAASAQAAEAPEPEGIRASPAARRMAKELGVNLALVKGTGPGGRIQGDDVRRFAEEMRQAPAAAAQAQAPVPAAPAAEAPAEAPAVPAGLPGRLVPLGRKRRITAERMSLSAHTVARITLNVDVDAAELMALRNRLAPLYEARTGARLSYDAVLAKVVGTALADHPNLNARWTDNGIYLVEPINVGVAIAVEDGLLVPVIRDADRKKLAEISAELGGLLAKAQQNRLSLDEMTGGTFTITNLGMYGVDSFVPIVNPPETAILGVGRIAERPVGRDGQIVLRPVMTLSLSVDHRVVDGAPAAQFLRRVKQLLEEPYLLI